ncbi:hypothetical protein Tco_0066361 [Tanacetum coccineum]
MVVEAKTAEVVKVITEYYVDDDLTKVVTGLKFDHCLKLLKVVMHLVMCYEMEDGGASLRPTTGVYRTPINLRRLHSHRADRHPSLGSIECGEPSSRLYRFFDNVLAKGGGTYALLEELFSIMRTSIMVEESPPRFLSIVSSIKEVKNDLLDY